MIIVSDTSGLFYLAQTGFIQLLPDLFQEVFIPKAVYEELREVRHLTFIQILLEEPWLQVIEVRNVYLVSQLEIYLDKGESEAIALAVQMAPDYILIDELKGREKARTNNLRVIGILGILVLAKQSKLVNKIEPIISKLMSETNFRCSNKLIKSICSKRTKYKHV